MQQRNEQSSVEIGRTAIQGYDLCLQLAEERAVEESAPAVAALKAAGAMLVGKTTCHELGIGMTGVNPGRGTARNPHDPRRTAGGAASGCAAIVASGLCAFAIGASFLR